mgnify:CR=1 FL=1
MVHLLQVYSNPSMCSVAPQGLLFRSAGSVQDAGSHRSAKRTARQLRDIEIDGLTARYLEVHKLGQVAREFRVSRTTVAKHLTDRGIETSRSMSTVDIERAVRLYSEGLSSVRIGERLGFDNHTILNGLRSGGVEIRRPAAQRTNTRSAIDERSYDQPHY